jgi:hypothetical protein
MDNTGTQRQTQITTQLEVLEKNIDELRLSLGGLSQRLTVALRVEPENAVMEKAGVPLPPTKLCPLASKLSKLSDDVVSQIKRISQLNDSLEL